MALNQIRNDFESFLTPLTHSKRIMLLVSFLVILLGMVTLIVLSHYHPWTVLESGLDPARSEFMLKQLHQHQIPAYLETGGSTLMVDSDLRDQALQLLKRPASEWFNVFLYFRIHYFSFPFCTLKKSEFQVLVFQFRNWKFFFSAIHLYTLFIIYPTDI